MTTTIFTDLGEGRITHRELQGLISIFTGERTYPRMMDAGLNGYKLGLFNQAWAEQTLAITGAETYYVQIVPIYSKFTDPNADPLKGVPTTENSTAGTTFYFEPFPDGYSCDGYEIWAGTVSGALYLQGTLDNRFENTFTIGVTWTYNTSGSTLSPLTIGPPAFASLVEIYQAEGEVNTRMFMGGGKVYSDGYATVAQTSSAPTLVSDTLGSITPATWAAVTDGSFRMRIDDYFYDFVNIDFTGDASMNDVASTLQTAIRAAQDPKLISGSGVETTVATWTAITDGSFNIKVNGVSYDISGLDFSGDASMADVASTIQTELQSSISTNLTCTWDATASRFVIEGTDDLGEDKITNGTFAADSNWTKGTDWTIGSGVANMTYTTPSEIYQLTGFDMRGKTIKVDFDIRVNTQAGANICDVALGGKNIGGNQLAADVTADLGAAGGFVSYSLTLKCDTAADNNDGVYFRIQSAATGDYDLDNVVLTEVPGTQNSIGFLSRHSSETGTDVSELMACRFDSAGIVLNRYGKGATTETVTYASNQLTITGSASGDAKRLSIMESVSADVGTDLTGSSWINADSDSNATYTPGKTAKRSVIGEGTEWGEWATGMKFRAIGEASVYLVKEVRSNTELVLDSDYEGDAFNGNTDYNLEPYSDRLYIFDRGNPFAIQPANIVKLPTGDSDEITAIWASGGRTAVFMSDHIWIVDAVSVTTPTKVSDVGTPNQQAVIRWEGGLAFFSGNDFKNLSGSRVRSLDPENRVKELISRMSPYTPYPHGVYLRGEDIDVMMWFVGLDDSRSYNTAICYQPKNQSWWLYNVKDANAATVIEDDAEDKYLITGSKYNSEHSVPSFTYFHDDVYKHDGASAVNTTTKQGVVASVGAATKTAGFLTCGIAFSADYTDWTPITDGYFSITIDGTDYDVGPVDFTGDTDMGDVAATIQTAIRAQTNGSETVDVGIVTNPVTSQDEATFTITSGTTTNISNVSFLRPYYPSTSITDLSGVGGMNGRENGTATETGAVHKITLTLNNDSDDASAALYTDNDGEKGCYLAFCDSDGLNLQYGLVVSNTVDTVTITPVPATLPEDGWYWYMGGIVPTWFKWFDFNSPQHKQKVHGVSVTADPEDDDDFNNLFLFGYQNLVNTIRTYKQTQIGSGSDTVNNLKPKDKAATHHGFKMIRPSSKYDLKIQDITITHRPRV